MSRLLFLFALAALAAPASAQDPKADALLASRQRLRVAYDCQTRGCDRAFFQTELPFVQFVRDQGDADVFVLITSDGTGGGGRRYSLFIEGRSTTEARSTLTVTVRADATDDDERRAIASRLVLGLAPFVARTQAADRLTFAYEAPPALEEAPQPEVDPWNGWSFGVDASGSLRGESASSAFNGNGRLSAVRVTDAWKTRTSLYSTYRRNTYGSFTDAGEDTTIVSERSDYGGSGLLARSINDRVSVGAELSASSSSYSNYRSRVVVGPGIEVSLFPYAESTRRLVTATYSVGVEAAAYSDTTIFGKVREVLPQHSVHINAELAQPWGSASVSLTGQQYVSQLDKYEVGVGGGIAVRLARGLHLNVGGSASIIENQLSLSAGGLTPEEILTQQQQQATSFRYAGNVGVSYAFGSIFNTVVNPRFGDRGVIIVG